jgi:hypothetical protein
MKKIDDSIPCDGAYKGVPIHAGQCPRRRAVVQADIDHVLGLGSDVDALILFLCNAKLAPEARLYGGARLHALHAAAARARDATPIDIDVVIALTAALKSRNWRSAIYYGSDICFGEGVRRDELDEPIVA